MITELNLGCKSSWTDETNQPVVIKRITRLGPPDTIFERCYLVDVRVRIKQERDAYIKRLETEQAELKKCAKRYIRRKIRQLDKRLESYTYQQPSMNTTLTELVRNQLKQAIDKEINKEIQLKIGRLFNKELKI